MEIVGLVAPMGSYDEFSRSRVAIPVALIAAEAGNCSGLIILNWISHPKA